MKQFTDNAGRQWNVELNVATVKRVRDLCGVDLLEASDREKNLLVRLISDPILLVDVIYCVCKPQADQQQVTDEDFGRAMAGDAIDAATEALLGEIVNFTPNPRDRRRLQKATAKMNAMLDRTREFLETKLDDPRLDANLESALRKFDESFTSSLESSASTPEDSPSAN